jgi:drug/metabolite transporter (DMT)-like permease
LIKGVKIMIEQYLGIGLGILGTFLISGKNNKIRRYGFIVYLVSNLSWSAYWVYMGDYSPLLQYAVFSVFNVMGYLNNR